MPKKSGYTKDGGYILDDTKITVEYARKLYRQMLKKSQSRGSKRKTQPK